jgi:hypothetical protein
MVFQLRLAYFVRSFGVHSCAKRLDDPKRLSRSRCGSASELDSTSSPFAISSLFAPMNTPSIALSVPIFLCQQYEGGVSKCCTS